MSPFPAASQSIGDSAFGDDSSLARLTIPTNTINIGDAAFNGCTSLTNIIIPKNVSSIGDDAFGDCLSLTAINVDVANQFYSSTNGVLFDKTQATLIQFPAGIAGSSQSPPALQMSNPGPLTPVPILSTLPCYPMLQALEPVHFMTAPA